MRKIPCVPTTSNGSATSPNRDEAEILNRFSIYEEIGSGGMAVVHRAIETLPNGDERVVALKRLHEAFADNQAFVETFVREARITRILNHPSIVQTFDHGPLPGSHFISMEFIQGHSLLKALRSSRRKPIPIHVVVSLLRDLFSGLHYIHSKEHNGEHLKLIHRDITPANLIINCEGRLRIIDFGVAKAALAGMQTRGNVVKGKLSYLAPESLTPNVELDARLDIFSAGVVAHELISGRPLFSRKTSRAQTIDSLLTAVIEPPSLFNKHCPPALDSLIMGALERDRESRLASASAALRKLECIAESTFEPADHKQVAHWCERAFGPVDHAARTARPSEVSVPEYDSYEVGVRRRPRNRFPAATPTTEKWLGAITTSRMPRPPHVSLLSSPVGKRLPSSPVSPSSKRALSTPIVLGDVRVTFHRDAHGPTRDLASGTPRPERVRPVAKGTSQPFSSPSEVLAMGETIEGARASLSPATKGTIPPWRAATHDVKMESLLDRLIASCARITTPGLVAILIVFLSAMLTLGLIAS